MIMTTTVEETETTTAITIFTVQLSPPVDTGEGAVERDEVVAMMVME